MKKIIFVALSTLVSVSAFAGANCQAHPEKERIPEAKFQQQLQQQGYKIKKFKADGNCYEIYGRDKQGRKVEIYFDTKTGQPVKSEIDD